MSFRCLFWFYGDGADGLGGIDDILVTKDGFENLTSTPKEITEMEKIINSS